MAIDYSSHNQDIAVVETFLLVHVLPSRLMIDNIQNVKLCFRIRLL